MSQELAATSGPTIRVVAPRREGMSQQARDFFYGRGGAAQPRTKKADRRSNAAGLS